jgi:tetraacyldisaccharide-1-P 4'-kinase
MHLLERREELEGEPLLLDRQQEGVCVEAIIEAAGEVLSDHAGKLIVLIYDARWQHARLQPEVKLPAELLGELDVLREFEIWVLLNEYLYDHVAPIEQALERFDDLARADGMLVRAVGEVV